MIEFRLTAYYLKQRVNVKKVTILESPIYIRLYDNSQYYLPTL